MSYKQKGVNEMKNIPMKKLTKEDLEWLLDKAIESNNIKRQKAIINEMNRRDQIEL